METSANILLIVGGYATTFCKLQFHDWPIFWTMIIPPFSLMLSMFFCTEVDSGDGRPFGSYAWQFQTYAWTGHARKHPLLSLPIIHIYTYILVYVHTFIYIYKYIIQKSVQSLLRKFWKPLKVTSITLFLIKCQLI